MHIAGCAASGWGATDIQSWRSMMSYLCNRRTFSVIAAGHLLAAAAIGLFAGAASAQSARPLEKITFLLDFVPYGKHVPFYAAIDKGIWKDAGFDVTIVKGEGSATTVSNYAAGTADFAMADTPTLIIARARGVPVKVAGIIHDKSLYALGTLE